MTVKYVRGYRGLPRMVRDSHRKHDGCQSLIDPPGQAEDQNDDDSEIRREKAKEGGKVIKPTLKTGCQKVLHGVGVREARMDRVNVEIIVAWDLLSRH